jgi:heterodisulfide reductase subunit A
MLRENGFGSGPTSGGDPPIRIGVYVCHCGTNIARTVNVERVTEKAGELPGVTIARDYKYMCSDPGQELIKEDIEELGLNRIVVASCSPNLHEGTFRGATAAGGLNPFFFQMVNIREHASWVHEDRESATDKAIDLVRAAVRRVRHHKALETRRVPIKPEVLVVGGGIAGISAALTLADGGKHVYLVEREASIGGHMAQFDKTFPTLDCAACILTPKMTQVRTHPNITLMTMTEVVKVDGFVGSYEVTVKHRPRYIDVSLCVGCQQCIDACVYKRGKFEDEFDAGLSMRKPIYLPNAQAVPQVVLIDPEQCIQFSSGKCKQTCLEACDRDAIFFDSAPSSWPPASRPSTLAALRTTATGSTRTSTRRWRWSVWSTHRDRPAARSFCVTARSLLPWGSCTAWAAATRRTTRGAPRCAACTR